MSKSRLVGSVFCCVGHKGTLVPLTVYGVLDCYAGMSAMGPDVASTLLYTYIYTLATEQSYKTFWRCNFSRSSNDKS